MYYCLFVLYPCILVSVGLLWPILVQHELKNKPLEMTEGRASLTFVAVNNSLYDISLLFTFISDYIRSV